MIEMSLHPIDRKDEVWSNIDLDRMFIFCMLDRAMPYIKVCKAFDHLDEYNLTTREGLKTVTKEELISNLRESGFRFPVQTATFLMEFSNNTINLRTATRDELVKNVKGIGYKLASMFLRNTRGEEYAVMDVHTKRYLKELGYDTKDYKEMEKIFKNIAKEKNIPLYDLDMQIWQERRVKLQH